MSVPNTVNILWQIPQYFLISVAEIMFGVAGLEFSFTQVFKINELGHLRELIFFKTLGS